MNLYPDFAINPDLPTHCLGCGKSVGGLTVASLQAGGINISCTCGAYSPIFAAMVDGEEVVVTVPLSLLRMMSDSGTTHVENYLGYSEHESALKSSMTHEMVEKGLTLQRDCKECMENGAYERAKARAKNI